MASFPTTLACLTTSGFKDALPVTRKYLGGVKEMNKPVVKASAFFTTHADFEAFMRWYITDIAWGASVFTITLPFFGVNRAWNVKLVKEPEIRPSDKASYIRAVDMELEVQDDIDTYIS